jgi:hypothetical protein
MWTRSAAGIGTPTWPCSCIRASEFNHSNAGSVEGTVGRKRGGGCRAGFMPIGWPRSVGRCSRMRNRAARRYAHSPRGRRLCVQQEQLARASGGSLRASPAAPAQLSSARAAVEADIIAGAELRARAHKRELSERRRGHTSSASSPSSRCHSSRSVSFLMRVSCRLSVASFSSCTPASPHFSCRAPHAASCRPHVFSQTARLRSMLQHTCSVGGRRRPPVLWRGCTSSTPSV